MVFSKCDRVDNFIIGEKVPENNVKILGLFLDIKLNFNKYVSKLIALPI